MKKQTNFIAKLRTHFKTWDHSLKLMKRLCILKYFSDAPKDSDITPEDRNYISQIFCEEDKVFCEEELSVIKLVLEEDKLTETLAKIEEEFAIALSISRALAADIIKQFENIILIENTLIVDPVLRQIVLGITLNKFSKLVNIKNCDVDLSLYLAQPISKNLISLSLSKNNCSDIFYPGLEPIEAETTHSHYLRAKDKVFEKIINIAEQPPWKHGLLFLDVSKIRIEVFFDNFFADNLPEPTYLFSDVEDFNLKKLFHTKVTNLIREFQVFADKFLAQEPIDNITAGECKTLIHIRKAFDCIKFLNKIKKLELPIYTNAEGVQKSYEMSDIQDILNLHIFQQLALCKNGHNILGTLPKWQIVTNPTGDKTMEPISDITSSKTPESCNSLPFEVANKIYKYLPEYCDNSWRIASLGDEYLQNFYCPDLLL